MPAMFANVRRVIETAGGTPDDIIKMTVWITDRALRPTLNKYWVEMFPDPHSRPARHTVASGDFTPPMQIQCDLDRRDRRGLRAMKIADIRTTALSYRCDPPYASAGGMQARRGGLAGRGRDR